MLADFFEPLWDFLFDKMGVFGMVIATATPVIALVLLFLIIAAIVGIFSTVKEKRLKKMYNKALYLEYRGRYPEAWKLFRKYAKKAKPSAEVYYHIGKFCEAALDNDYDWAYSKKDMKPSYWFRKARALGSENSECELLKARFFKSFPSDLLESAKILKEVNELGIKKVPGAVEVMDKILLEISEKVETGVISDLESGAILEDKDAQILLVRDLFEEKKDKEGIDWLIFSAESGNADAQFLMANFYRGGSWDNLVQKNPRKAIEFYKKAAENGIEKAKVALGDMYYKGEGCEKDFLEAAKWFAKAADEDNNAAAAHNAAICYNKYAVKDATFERHVYNIKHHRVEEGKQEVVQMLNYMKLAADYSKKAEELGFKTK